TDSTTVRAIATDRFGNDGPFAELVITVLANQPPSIQFTRITPASGNAPSGSFVAVDVTAADDSGVAELRAIVAGIGAGDLAKTNATKLRVQGFVSTAAGPGQQVQIFAEAIDTIGQSSGQQVFALDISDGTKPTLAVTSPPAQSTIDPGATVPLTLQLNDNFGVSRVDLNVTGAFTSTVQSALSPVVTNGVSVVDLIVPVDTPTNHEPVLLSFTARDEAGNVSATINHALRMTDTTPPVIVGLTPADGATGVDPQPVIEIVFSEPLDTNTVTAAGLSLVPDAGGDAIALSLDLQPDLVTLVAVPTAALEIDTSYRLTVTTALADASGNPLAAESVTTFQTGDFRLTSPVQGQQVVEGEIVTLAAESSTLTFAKVRFLAGGIELIVDDAAPFSTDHTVPTLVELGGSTLTYTAEALDTGEVKVAEASATVTVFAADVDTDGDGVTNGEELLRGTNPFKPDALPVIDFPATIEIVQGVLTNFPVNATDADGNLRELRVAESGGSESRGKLVAEFRNLTFTPSAMSQIDFNTPAVLTTEVAAIRFPSTGTSPWPGAPVQATQVASRFIGRLIVVEAGAYQFRLTSDDGAEVDIDGNIIVSRANGAGAATASATLAAGSHDFELRHFNGAGPGNLTLEWSGPGFGFRVVAADDFSGLEVFRFQETGTASLSSATDVQELTGTLELLSPTSDSVQLELVATDSDFLEAVQLVDVVVLADLDGDTIPDRDDPDIDGDGLSNDDELLAGTDPRNTDSDGDTIDDGTDRDPVVASWPPTAGAPVTGQALEFDGVDDVAQVAYQAGSPLFALRDSLTFELWVNPAGPGWLLARNQCGPAWPATDLSLGGDGAALSLSFWLNHQNQNSEVVF
ncbi:MAG TPA: Ig-like domain-containing protein, partial [Verrucomicrobiae bacterium]|nr:Ig-like domain-containing protein [Verrucomicrobiae bacterium]